MAKNVSRGFLPNDDDAEPSKQGKRRPPRFVKPTTLRIIGGDLKRRSVLYHGDLATRPMKDNIRENLFNILGKAVQGTIAWDLFAGTGVLGIESISRGAQGAVAIDLSRNSVRWIQESASRLGIPDRLEVLCGDAFRIVQTRFSSQQELPLTVFCCPPYRMWETHLEPLRKMIYRISAGATEGGYLVCESDHKFDQSLLPEAPWDFRQYGNTRLAFCELTSLQIPSSTPISLDR